MTARLTLSQLEQLRTAGGLGAVPASQGDGSVLMEYPHAQDTQTEALTLSVNPDTGADPASPIRIKTQAQATAYGKFASVRGAIEALAPSRGVDIEIVIDDGSYSLNTRDFFTGLNRLQAVRVFDGANVINQITIRSSSVVTQVAGTVTSQVLSHVDEWDITLTADPGYVANEHRGKYLMIVAGTGVGQYRSIRNHSGASFQISGPFDALDGTSQVEIFEPAATLDFAAPVPIYGHPSSANGGGEIVIEGLSITCSGAKVMHLFDGSFYMIACYTNCLWYLYGATLNVMNFVVDGGGANTVGLQLWHASLRGGSGFLVYGCTTAGVYLEGSYGPSAAFIYRGAVEDCPIAFLLELSSNLRIYSWMNTSGCDYGVSIRGGSAVIADMSYQVGASCQLSGDVADIELGDGLGTLSWEELDALSDKLAIGGTNMVRGE